MTLGLVCFVFFGLVYVGEFVYDLPSAQSNLYFIGSLFIADFVQITFEMSYFLVSAHNINIQRIRSETKTKFGPYGKGLYYS